MKVQLFYNTLMKPDSNGRCLSAKSVKNVHIVFRAAMQQAVEIDLIKKNPCTKARLPRVYKTEIKPLSDAEIQEFIRLSQSDDIYGTVLRVILFTGLREAEALGLTWDCVDFHNGTILINKQLQRRPQSAGGTQLTPTKNGKSRVLRPARYVMQTLKQRYTEQVMQCMRAGSDWQAWHTMRQSTRRPWCSPMRMGAISLPSGCICISKSWRRKQALRMRESTICGTPLR